MVRRATTSALIGVLGSGSQSAFAAHIDAFRQALRERGYVEGRSVRLEERWAEGRLERLPAASDFCCSAGCRGHG